MNEEMQAKFWTRVDIGEPDECWEWTGGRRNGYGRCWYPGRTTTASRLAYELANDSRVPRGTVVRHTCDNPPCCNPAHLILGTPRQNMLDCGRRGRLASKLTAEQVLEIRRWHFRDGLSSTEIQARACIGQPEVSRILTRQRWRWLRDEFPGREVVPDGVRRKLTKEDAAQIRRRARAGEKHRELAEEFGVSRSVVTGISSGRAWRCV